MSESRKNHLNIDGAQVKEDDRVDSYKPIPEADQGNFIWLTAHEVNLTIYEN